MGRLTLNVLLSFAQFEREVAGERIRDKFAASRPRRVPRAPRSGTGGTWGQTASEHRHVNCHDRDPLEPKSTVRYRN
jgi:DNA invertase Pin-like site-specific DNA recombinase